MMSLIILSVIVIIILYVTYKKNEKFYNFQPNLFFNEQLEKNEKEFILYNLNNNKHNPKYFNANTEMYNQDFQKILNQLISNGKQINIQTKSSKINNKIYLKIKYQLLKKINKIVSQKYNSITNFEIIQDTIINYKENIKYIQMYFIIDIFQKQKYLGFQLYILSIYNKQNNESYFKKIIIKGNFNSSDVLLNPGYEKNEHIQIHNNYPYSQYNADKTYLMNSTNDKILPSQKQLNSILKNKKINNKKHFIQNSYQCYGSKGEDYYNCISDKNSIGNPKTKGIWDRPCYTNNDCPFYKANKNYSNNRGGCIQGICEMPLNIQPLTYRYYDKNTKPYCYNCKGKTNKCCDYQMKNNNKMLSPDYIFIGDKNDRFINRRQLETKNLLWYKVN